jgi:hypothetical protein
MGTVKDAADKAKVDVERIEAKEDEALAHSRKGSARLTKVDRPRGASLNQADKAKADVERVEAEDDEAVTHSRQRSER